MLVFVVSLERRNVCAIYVPLLLDGYFGLRRPVAVLGARICGYFRNISKVYRLELIDGNVRYTLQHEATISYSLYVCLKRCIIINSA